MEKINKFVEKHLYTIIFCILILCTNNTIKDIFINRNINSCNNKLNDLTIKFNEQPINNSLVKLLENEKIKNDSLIKQLIKEIKYLNFKLDSTNKANNIKYTKIINDLSKKQ